MVVEVVRLDRRREVSASGYLSLKALAEISGLVLPQRDFEGIAKTDRALGVVMVLFLWLQRVMVKCGGCGEGSG